MHRTVSSSGKGSEPRGASQSPRVSWPRFHSSCCDTVFTFTEVPPGGAPWRGPPEGSPGAAGSVAHASLHFLRSHEQSNDELVTEILSDMTKRVPLSVEKEECTGMPSTLKSIMSSPIWDSLYKSIDGKHVPGVPSPPRPPPQRRDTGIRRQVEQGGQKRPSGVGG